MAQDRKYLLLRLRWMVSLELGVILLVTNSGLMIGSSAELLMFGWRVWSHVLGGLHFQIQAP